MELWYEQEYFNPYNFFCNETTVKIKLGSLRLMKNTLVNNSENPDGVKKNNYNSWKALQLMCISLAKICWERSANWIIDSYLVHVIAEETM